MEPSGIPFPPGAGSTGTGRRGVGAGGTLWPRAVVMSRFILALRTFLALALPYFRSEDRWPGRALAAGVIALEFALVYVAVAINQWHGRFFNALEARDWDRVGAEFAIFGLILIGTVTTGLAQYWLGQHFQIRWRRWMTERFAGIWMADARHYRIRFVDDSVDNIHLRIANDISVFIQKTHEIGSGLVGVVITLISFAVILWGISSTTPMPLFGIDFSFPGYLIVVALLFAAMGTLLAHLIGRRLIFLNFNQQRREADLRFATARVTDHSEQVALLRAEPVERAEIRRRFDALARNWTALAAVQTRLTGFIFGYTHVSSIFPTLVVTPAYLYGFIPLGVLMQAAQAFQRVEGSFAYGINAYSKIAEWKAAMDRLWQLDVALRRTDTADLPHAAIDRRPAPTDLSVRDLVLQLPSGEPIAAMPDVTLTAGDRLLLSGGSGTGKSSLIRALSGIWPYGAGQIALPPDARVFALSARPYFPLGTLRQVIAVPVPAGEIVESALCAAMAAVGLHHLIGRLDEEAEWSNVLSGGDQQRIGFARVLLYRPTVLLLDDAVSSLDEPEARELYRVVREHLPGTIIISAGRATALASLHRHTLVLNPIAPVPRPDIFESPSRREGGAGTAVPVLEPHA
jgi:putative ATP-binding cassette transporter